MFRHQCDIEPDKAKTFLAVETLGSNVGMKTQIGSGIYFWLLIGPTRGSQILLSVII